VALPALSILSSRGGRLGAALILLAIVLLAASFPVQRSATTRLAGDRPVNANAGDGADISAHNSPTIVRNPRDEDNLVVTDRIDSPDFSCAMHASFDGGDSWTHPRVPIPPGPGRKCFAPDAAFGADGTLYVSYVTLQGRGNTPAATWVASSRDGGRTLTAPTKVTGPLAFQVRITADPQRPGTLYLTWVKARDVALLRFTGPGNPIQLARSTDGGRSWSDPVRVNAPSRGRVIAPSAAIGPDGALYVLHLDLGDDRLDYEGGHDGYGGPPYAGRFTLVVARSQDQGATWAESVVDDGVVPTTRFIPFLPVFPSLAVDRERGRLYVGYEDRRLGDSDIWVWRLERGAARWSEPVRVNDTPRPDGSTQNLAKLAVAPNGRLDVVYYDRRDDPRRDTRNDVSLQSSFDGGRTFDERISLSSSYFDARIGFGSERDMPDLGSRLGLVSADDEAIAVWSDTRAGTDASRKQDLHRARVDSGSSSSLPLVLRIAATALALGGVFLLVAAARRRREPAS
jgi:hypothetical protein